VRGEEARKMASLEFEHVVVLFVTALAFLYAVDHLRALYAARRREASAAAKDRREDRAATPDAATEAER
jgi:hypothetical protein